MQYYVPPKIMVNKDFLRQILAEDKQFMPMSEVKIINVPKYDEVSVKNLWPHCNGIPELMVYFPDKLPKNRLPDREFFFNILNSLNPSYVANIIEHATKMRNSAEGFNTDEQSIVVSQKMIGLLNQSPFISCKCEFLSELVQNAKEKRSIC